MNISGLDPYLSLAVIGVTFVLIFRNTIKPGVSLMLAVIVFMITGILTPQEVLKGFSNDKIASILLLILIAAGLKNSFDVHHLFDRMFMKAKGYKSFLFQMMSQSALISALINNTPVVALLTPYTVEWANRNKIAPSKLLIPLSFATIMGGMLTVIGTSTTLLLNGFLTEANQINISTGDLLFLGGLVVVTGITFFLTVGHHLLPTHGDPAKDFEQQKAEYLVEVRLIPDSEIVGQSIDLAGLRNVPGGYLVEVVRKGRLITPVEPEFELESEDVLIFAGDKKVLIDFIEGHDHLNLPNAVTDILEKGDKHVIETVISAQSSLIGRKVRDSNFRERYDAAIVAIQRGGEKIKGKIGDIRLTAGDMLLLYTGKDFVERSDIYRDLLVISTTKEQVLHGKKKLLALAVVLAGLCLLYFFGDFSLFPSLLIIFSVMTAFGMITMTDMKRELDLNLVAILVFSLAVGFAIIKTGAAKMVSDWILIGLEPFGAMGILIGLVAIATLLTTLIGNVGAISISFPLAFEMTQSLNIESPIFYLGIAFGASAAFLTPISYQTNLIVYGPGNYSFADFFRIGLPVTIIYLGMAFLGILMLYGEHLS